MRRLIIRPGGIGDFIVSIPALECLRTRYLEVWTTQRNVPLVRFADHTRSIDSTGLNLLGISDPPAALLEQLGSFDSIISWYGSNRPDFRELVRRLNLPFTFFPALPPSSSGIHAADFYLNQVRSIAACDSDGIPRIRCGAEPADFAVIQPFSGSPNKNWPLANFERLADRLSRVMPVHWCCGLEDPPLASAVQIDNLYELACWISRARLYIGNDSGITHLAAATGVPVLALFGPTDPAVWGPRGPHVRIARFAATGV